MQFLKPGSGNWRSKQELPSESFVCGYCNNLISSNKGYAIGALGDGSGKIVGAAYICTHCSGITFFAPSGVRYPASALGNTVRHVPDDLDALYQEARRCTGQSCYTAAVLLCRKMLMNVAVHQGAKENMKFIEYVEYLSSQGFVPPNGKIWVDHIRKKGNEATHEIALMTEADAKNLMSFVEMLLRFVYEFPGLVPASDG